MPKVLITAPWFTKIHLERLSRRFSVTTNTLKRWFTEEELVDVIADYDAVIAGLDPFTNRVIERADRLKIVARRGIGFDNVDLKACKKNKIMVTNTPVPEEHQAVAEFTVALILDVTKNVTKSACSLKNGSCEREAFLGRNIKGMTVGVVGLGNVGRAVARLISAFGANVIYHDPNVDSKEFEAVGLPELFSRSDIVTVHLPKSRETARLIGSALLGRMKSGSYFVDTSRAGVVVHDDFLESIRSRRIVAAAFDVFDIEPPVGDPLLTFDNVLTTPHIAGLTVESFDQIDNVCVNNVIRVLEGRGNPEFVVNA